MKAETETDFAFQPQSTTDGVRIVELFVVAKLNNGSCHLVVTEPDIDSEILDFLHANSESVNGNLTLVYPNVPLQFTHFDGRKC